MSKKRLLAAALGIVLVGAAAAFWRAQSAAPVPTPTPVAAIVDTTPAIRARGTIGPVRQTKLAFRAGGQVRSVGVKVGDAVKAGEVLATLDTRELDLAVKTAQDNLTLSQLAMEEATSSATPEEIAAAEAAIAASEARYQELTNGSTKADILAAESAVVAARQQLAQAEASTTADEKTARASLDVAKAKLDQIEAGPRAEDIRAAEIQVEQAKVSLWSTQTSRDGTCGSAFVQRYQCDSANASVSASEMALAAAENNLARQKSGPSREDVVAAQSAVEQAQAQLDSRLATRDQTLTSARSAVAAAESRLERVKSGSTDSELKSGQSSVAAAKAALAAKRAGSAGTALETAKVRASQAETGLAQAKLALDGAKLSAPYDGTVAAVLIAEHDYVGSGATAVVFADLAALQIETADLDQGSIGRLSVGQPVEVRPDVFEDKVLAGKLLQLAPLATSSETGEVNYSAVVSLDETDPDLRWGMTARLEFLPR